MIIQKRESKREKVTQNRTYAEMLQEAGDQMPDEESIKIFGYTIQYKHKEKKTN